MKDENKTRKQLIEELRKLRRRLSQWEKKEPRRRRTDHVLRGGKDNFRALAENAKDGILIATGEGNYVYANKVAAKITGYSIDELLNLSMRELTHPAEHKKVIERYRKRRAGKAAPKRYETVIVRKDGQSVPIELTAAKTVWQGQPAGLAIIRDISKRRQAETALRQSEERYKALFARSLYCVYVHDFDGRFMDLNQAALDLLGYKKKDIPNLTVASLFDEDQLPRAMKNLEETKKKGFRTEPSVYRLRRKDGSHVWVETEASVINREGKPYALQGIARDITEKKLAEEALRETEERFRLAFEGGPIGMAIVGLDYRFLKANQVLCKMLGYTEHELSSRTFINVTHPKDVKKDSHLAARVFQGKIPSYHIEKRYIKKNGEILWAELTATVIRDQDGKALYGLAMIEDITERKQTEKRLHLLSAVVEQSSEGIAATDLEGNLLFVNNAFAAIHGYKPEELIGRHLSIFHTPEQIPSVKAARRQVHESSSFSGELWHVRRDGTVFPTLMHNSLLRDESGNPIGMIGTIHDITERKQAEQALRESEEQYRALVEESLQGLIITTRSPLRIAFVNSRAADILGYTVDELMALPHEDLLGSVHYEDQATVLQRMQQYLRDEPVSPSFEFRIVRRDRIVRWVELFSTNMLYHGEPAVQTAIMDITERTQAEMKLREREKYFSHLIQNSSDLIMVVEEDGTIRYIGPSVEQLYGYKPADLVDTNMFEHLHPEDIPKIKAFYNHAVRKPGLTPSIEHRIRREDGSWVFVESVGNNLLGNPIVEGLIVNTRDVTERKRAEEALREREEKYRAVVTQSADAVFLVDIETRRILEANPALEDLLGYTLEEIQGLTLYDFVAHDKKDIDQKIKQILGERSYFIGERRYRRKDGTFVDVEVNTGLISYGGRDVISVVSRDITMRQQAEQELHKYRARLEYLVEERTAELLKTNENLTAEIEQRKSVEQVLTVTKARLEYLLSSSPAVLYTSKATGDYSGTFISENVTTLLGHKPQAFLDDPKFWIKHIHPEDKSRVLGGLPDVIKKGDHTHDYRFLHKDGSYRWMRDEFKVIRDASGKPEIIGYWIDITERKKAEEALRQSEETMRALLNASTETALLLDLNETILGLNDVAAKRLGKPADDLVGTCALDLFPPDLAKSRRTRGEEVVRSKKPVRYEDEREGRIYDTSAYPVFDSQHRVVQLAIFARDITEHKEAELRNQIKAQLLNTLRDSKTIEDCLQLGCQAVRDARLFERAVLTLHNERREITHLGQVGLDQKVIERARKAPPPDKDLTKKMTQKKFQISHSFFVPIEATLAYRKTGRYIPQKKLRGEKTTTWKSGDELFVPIVGKDGSAEGYLSVDTPTNGERPKRNTILYLEDIVDIVARQIREMQNVIRLRNSEQKYRELTDLLPQTVFEIDLQGNLTFTNRYGLESFGYTQKDLDRGLSVLQLFVPKDTARIKLNIQKRVTGESFEDHEYTALTKDGRTFPVLIYSSPIIHDDKPIGLRGIVLDITDRKRAEDELRAEKDKLDLITRNIGVGVAIISKDFRTLWANKVLQDIFGDVEGKTCYTTYNQRTAVCPGCGVKQVFATGKTNVVHEQVGKDDQGNTIWSQIIATPIRDEQGNITAAHEVVVPITERKRMELTQRALQQIANAVHTTEDLNELYKIIHNELGAILNTENFFIALLDKESDTISFPYHKDERDPWVETLPAGKTLTGYAIRNDKPLLATAKEIKRLAKNGDIALLGVIPKIWLGVPMRVRGEMIGALVVQNYADETALGIKDLEILQFASGQVGLSIQRKRAEDELKQTLQELARSNAELEQFAYVASHDLQEPLQAVAMSVGIVAKRYENKLDKEANKFIDYAVDESNRMQMLVEDLLAYSRVGKGGVEFEPTDCLLVLDQTLDNLLVPIERSNAKITHGPLPAVMGDPIQLTQLFQNLLDNAIKFCGEKPPRIHVSAKQKEDQWIFSVRDHGIGFDSQHVERIFTAFERLLSKTEYPGTGIGLAICRKIVERHGGRIWAKSMPGKGATFYFTIPVMKGASLK